MSDVIGRLKNGAEGAFSVVQTKLQLKNLLCNLRAEVKLLENERRELTARLGEMVYAMHRQGGLDPTRVRERCLELERVERQLEEKWKEIRACESAIAGVKPNGAVSYHTCDCGAPLGTAARFCSSCGRPTTPPHPNTSHWSRALAPLDLP